MHNFKELKVWQKARKLSKLIYIQTRDFPKEELYGMTSQMRRCAISISSNIAEGCGRGTDSQLLHFLGVSQGSAFELESQVILAADLSLLAGESAGSLLSELEEIQKMIRGFRNSLQNKKTTNLVEKLEKNKKDCMI